MNFVAVLGQLSPCYLLARFKYLIVLLKFEFFGCPQLVKTDGGVKVLTDHGEEIEADVVLFATGIFYSLSLMY